MMWAEFEELYGARVRYDDYKNIIEPMYMACPESITKQEFVKMLDKKRFAIPTKRQYENMLKKAARDMYEKCGHVTIHDEKRALYELACNYAKDIYGIERDDTDKYLFFNHGYEFPNMRGCSFPRELVIGRFFNQGKSQREYCRLVLIEETTVY